MRADVGEHERSRVLDQHAEDPAARAAGRRSPHAWPVDAAGEEALERLAPLVEHADGRVARAGQLPGGLEQPLQHDLEVELGDERTAGLEEPGGRDVVRILRHGADSTNP